MKLLDALRVVLIIFVPFYLLAVNIRNFLFDKGILKQTSVNVPVISVGNLTVGGSGKTPLTIYISNLLKGSGYIPGILSRGYGRRTKGYIYVSDGTNFLRDVEDCGDEIYQTVQECSVPAAVCEKRVEGAIKFLEDSKLSSIVLDDAFQHRWLKRNLDILIFPQRFLVEENPLRRLVLPTGNMREGFKSMKRANIVIINRKFSEKKELTAQLCSKFVNANIFYSYYEVMGFIDIKTDEYYQISDFYGQKSIVVSGIANPHSFLKGLQDVKIDTSAKIIFIDHKNYTIKEVEQIRKLFYETNANSVITTHKDAVKLARFSKQLDDIDIYYLKIRMRFEKEDEFNNLILSSLLEAKIN